ncbi:unnamed protein product [Rotaria sordida]|uniref:Endonuclease/exonuclease/phosphatase domain-containing protein n=1 Tax=Rotaria sordida TaxID=392033 RepID=A0A819JP79_9BILA|nr:unnamed protein product [Rotaria sordida]CAF3933735.1 unnamed protein product [Rotaria sordida]
MIRIKNNDDHHASISTFTILTYNCLASNLAEPKYFPQTDPTHLDFSYRSKLFEHELQLFNADIVCLQEIHQDNFHQWLSPFLFQLGYDEGTFAKRGGIKAKDGVVIFFKRDKFKLITQHRLDYFDSAQIQFPTEASLATYNVALFCLLQIQNNKTNVSNEEEQQIWICNTHLNWNHTLPATQFFQIRTLINELTRLNKETCNKPFVIVGDFNSTHDSVVHDYIRNGFLTDTVDYYSKLYQIYLPLFDGDSTKTRKYLTESHMYKNVMESAYNKNTFLMPFTRRVTDNFCGTIDYIYYQRDRMCSRQLLNVLHNDGERAMHDDFTLPNSQHPSDHLPLMAELDLLPLSTENDNTNK